FEVIYECTFFFFQAEDGIRGFHVTGVQTCALPISGEGRVRGWCRLVRSARGERRPRNPGGHSGERRRGGQTSPLVGTGGHGTVCWRAGALSVAARARGAGVVDDLARMGRLRAGAGAVSEPGAYVAGTARCHGDRTAA